MNLGTWCFKMVKCPCGKNIVFKCYEEREVEEEEESTGSYVGTTKGFHGGRNPNAETRKVKIYHCEDNFCMFSSDMTEDEVLELEDNQNDEI
jgi:hypothetical protein